MSLIAHYKLDGNILDDSVNKNHLTYIYNTNKLVPSNGKINGCYVRNVVNDGADLFRSQNTVYLIGDFTFSCWANIIGVHSGTANGVVTNHSHVDNTGAGITIREISSTDYRISCNTGDGTNRTFNTYYGTSNIKDKWSLLTLTYSRSENKIKLWVDGNLENEISYNLAIKDDYIDIFNWSTTYASGAAYRPAGYIDDVRIYDHALSDKEIKELAKGLVLHYTFDDFQEPTTNLVSNPTNEVISTSSEFMQWGDLAPIFDAYGTSVKYSLSMDIKTSIGGTLLVYMQNGSSSKYSFVGENVETTTTYKRYYFNNLTAAISTPTDTLAMLAFYGVYGTGRYPSVKNVQIEIKEYCTPFVVGSRTGKIIDNSGNGNDAILTDSTTPKWVEESKIGSGCYSFNGQNRVDLPTSVVISALSNHTYCAWIKLNSTFSTTGVIFGGAQSTTNSFGINGNRQLYGGEDDSMIVSPTSLNLDTWYHVVYCFEFVGGNVMNQKLYVNGELNNTRTDSAYVDTYISTINYLGYDSRFAYYFNGIIDDFRLYSTTLSDSDVLQLYQNRHSLDSNGNFFTPKLNEIGHKALLLDYTQWQDGQTGSVSGFGINGDVSENHRVISDDPWGKPSVVWRTKPDAVSGADGGWDTSYHPINRNYTYRFSVWVRRYTSGVGGTFYLGLNPAPIRNDNGLVQSNPYFTYPSISSLDAGQWYMVVAHCFYETYNGGRHPDSGWYVNGNKISDFSYGNVGDQDVRWASSTTSVSHRAYHFYTTNVDSGIDFIYPRLDICDGTEPSITELLAGYDSNNIDYIRTIGGGRNLSLDAGSSLSNIGKISEVGITNGLVAYYPLDGNANDYSGNNYGGTVIGATLASGVINNCYLFDGISNKIKIENNILQPTTSFSVSCWFMNKGNNGTYRCAIHRGSDTSIGNTDFWIGIQTGNLIVGTIGANSGVGWAGGQTTITAVLDVWYNVTTTWNGSTVKTYINGSMEKEYSLSSVTFLSTPTRIGASSDTTNYVFNGLIDDVRIYNRELSSEEVIILYEMGVTDKKMKLSKDTVYIKGELKEGY